VHGIGNRLAGDDPVVEDRAAAADRDVQRLEHLVAQLGRPQDQPRLELAGRRVESGVQDPGVRPARRAREPVARLEQDRVEPTARERQRHRSPDDPAAR
jgi:hypothetical protein